MEEQSNKAKPKRKRKSAKVINILAHGPSSKDIDFSLFEGLTTMVVNHHFIDVKPDYFCSWDIHHLDKPIDAKGIFIWPITQRVDFNAKLFTKGVEVYKNNLGDKFLLDNPEQVPNINLGGVLAISAAIRLGYKVIYLFGFDGGPEAKYARYNDKYRLFSYIKGITILNVNLDSAIDAFPVIALEDWQARVGKLQKI